MKQANYIDYKTNQPVEKIHRILFSPQALSTLIEHLPSLLEELLTAQDQLNGNAASANVNEGPVGDRSLTRMYI